MTNTSATGGVLLPDDAITPKYGNELEDVLQSYVVALTGLPGAMVRPRVQPTAPKQPEPSVDWCAVGVPAIKETANPVIRQLAADSSRYEIHETIEVLCSFYGPNSQSIAAQFRDGLFIRQNNQFLAALMAAFLSADRIISAPELVNQFWVKRYDITVRFRRQVVRQYPIQSFLTAPSVTQTGG